jgi:hypothetical protein
MKNQSKSCQIQHRPDVMISDRPTGWTNEQAMMKDLESLPKHS